MTIPQTAGTVAGSRSLNVKRLFANWRRLTFSLPLFGTTEDDVDTVTESWSPGPVDRLIQLQAALDRMGIAHIALHLLAFSDWII